MRREEHVDYHLVADEHLAIHARLEAWARWVRVRPTGWQVTPMFRQYRSNSWQWHPRDLKVETNVPEALEVERAVSLLPEKNRTAIRWCYIQADGPVRMCRELEVNKAGLLKLICDARTILVNGLSH